MSEFTPDGYCGLSDAIQAVFESGLHGQGEALLNWVRQRLYAGDLPAWAISKTHGAQVEVPRNVWGRPDSMVDLVRNGVRFGHHAELFEGRVIILSADLAGC